MSQNITHLTNSTETSNLNNESYWVSELNIFLVLIFAICAGLFVSCALKFLVKRK